VLKHLAEIAGLNCRVTGQQDVLLAVALPAASSKALSQALPTASVAASERMVRRNLAESPLASPPSERQIANATEPFNTYSVTGVSQPNAAITSDDGTTQTTEFVPIQQQNPTTSDIAVFLIIAGVSAAVGALCCLGGAVVLRLHARRQASPYFFPRPP